MIGTCRSSVPTPPLLSPATPCGPRAELFQLFDFTKTLIEYSWQQQQGMVLADLLQRPATAAKLLLHCTPVNHEQGTALSLVSTATVCYFKYIHVAVSACMCLRAQVPVCLLTAVSKDCQQKPCEAHQYSCCCFASTFTRNSGEAWYQKRPPGSASTGRG